MWGLFSLFKDRQHWSRGGLKNIFFVFQVFSHNNHSMNYVNIHKTRYKFTLSILLYMIYSFIKKK